MPGVHTPRRAQEQENAEFEASAKGRGLFGSTLFADDEDDGRGRSIEIVDSHKSCALRTALHAPVYRLLRMLLSAHLRSHTRAQAHVAQPRPFDARAEPARLRPLLLCGRTGAPLGL